MHATESSGSARSRSTSAGSGSSSDISCGASSSQQVSSELLKSDNCTISTMGCVPSNKVRSHPSSCIEPPPGLEDWSSSLSKPEGADSEPLSSIGLPPGLASTNAVHRSTIRLPRKVEAGAEVPVQSPTRCAPPAPPAYMPILHKFQERPMPPPPAGAAPEQAFHELPKSRTPPPPPCAPPKLSHQAQPWECAPPPGMSMPPPPPAAAPEQVPQRLPKTSIPPSPPCGPPRLSPQAQLLACAPAPPTWSSPPCGPPNLSPQAQLLASAPAPPTWSCEINIAEPLVESMVGSSTMPTVGSAGHRLGTCKPCAFFHTKGCGNGPRCIYCHLCESGEKKRRQKVKRAAVNGATGRFA